MNEPEKIQDQLELLHMKASRIDDRLNQLRAEKNHLVGERRQVVDRHNKLLLGAQIRQWASEGKKLCRECKQLKPIKVFSYLTPGIVFFG